MVSIVKKYVETNEPKSDISPFKYYEEFIKESNMTIRNNNFKNIMIVNLGYKIKRNSNNRYWSKED